MPDAICQCIYIFILGLLLAFSSLLFPRDRDREIERDRDACVIVSRKLSRKLCRQFDFSLKVCYNRHK